jgi:hypothetical protein
MLVRRRVRGLLILGTVSLKADWRERNMTRKPFVVLALSASLTVAAFAAPATVAKAGKATVGDFAVKVAAVLGYAVTDQEKAADALRAKGVDLMADLSATLTEGEAARIMSDLGVAVNTPVNSGNEVSDARASIMAGALSQMALESFSTQDTGPTQCLSSVDRGTCVNCCKAATGLTGKFCGRYCHANVPPPPSPTEPTP